MEKNSHRSFSFSSAKWLYRISIENWFYSQRKRIISISNNKIVLGNYIRKMKEWCCFHFIFPELRQCIWKVPLITLLSKFNFLENNLYGWKIIQWENYWSKHEYVGLIWDPLPPPSIHHAENRNINRHFAIEIIGNPAWSC